MVFLHVFIHRVVSYGLILAPQNTHVVLLVLNTYTARPVCWREWISWQLLWLKTLMLGHGGSSAGSYLADPTSPIPSHCAVIILFQSVAVHQLSWLALQELSRWTSEQRQTHLLCCFTCTPLKMRFTPSMNLNSLEPTLIITDLVQVTPVAPQAMFSASMVNASLSLEVGKSRTLYITDSV